MLLKVAAEVEASTSKASGSRRSMTSSQRMLSAARQAKKLKNLPRNRDLPTKEEVDRDQAEQESLTWADR